LSKRGRSSKPINGKKTTCPIPCGKTSALNEAKKGGETVRLLKKTPQRTSPIGPFLGGKNSSKEREARDEQNTKEYVPITGRKPIAIERNHFKGDPHLGREKPTPCGVVRKNRGLHSKGKKGKNSIIG